MIRSRYLTVPVAVLAAVTARPVAATADEAQLFVLRRGETEFSIDVVPIEANEVKVVPADGDVLDLIFPVGPGQSASLVTPGDVRMFVARHTGTELRVEVRMADGSTRDLPARSLEDLATHNIRVNVTGDGRRAAFLIERHRTVEEEVGPVANMFAGQLPEAMLEQSYVVQTETYRSDAGPPITGIVPLDIARWPFVEATLPDGTTTDLLVDIGAAGTVIDRSHVPAGVLIEETSMVEYSAAGRRTLKYAPGGATGQVQTVIGQATLERIVLGDLAVPEVRVDVMETMPDMFGRPVGGILGMDVLRRCERLVLVLEGEQPRLEFDADAAESSDAIECPFAFVSTHVVIGGSVNGTRVFFILDTGAPTTFLDESAAKAADVRADASKDGSARGLDGGRVAMARGRIGTLSLGDASFEHVGCRISSLAAFNALRGEGQYAGLLGNDFFSRFDRVEIDFARRVVRFIGRR